MCFYFLLTKFTDFFCTSFILSSTYLHSFYLCERRVSFTLFYMQFLNLTSCCIHAGSQFLLVYTQVQDRYDQLILVNYIIPGKTLRVTVQSLKVMFFSCEKVWTAKEASETDQKGLSSEVCINIFRCIFYSILLWVHHIMRRIYFG